MRRLLHLVGSPTSDRLAELSLLYARDCLRATSGVADPTLAYVGPDGWWRFPDGLAPEQIEAAAALSTGEAMSLVDHLALDAMLPQMFCLPGMTHYRALFDVLGVPYLGNRPAVMALAADKAQTKAVAGSAGVDVPAGEVVGPGEPVSLRPPVVVKPVDGDNSDGVTLVRDPAQLDEAVALACRHGRAALVEEYVELGREVRCGLLQRDGELVALPLEEYAVDPVAKPVRGPADKLVRDAHGALSLVAKDADHAWLVDPGDPVNAPVARAARRAHRALGCRHYSLFDFRIDPTGRPWLLEAGLYCSFARQSVIATMAASTGLPVDALLAVVLGQALSESKEGSPS